MKKTTAGLTFAAATGLGLLTAGPVMAAGPGGGGGNDGGDGHQKPPYVNCDEAAAENVYNIPSTHPRYGVHLDNDMDGIGCEDSTKPMAAVAAPQAMDANGTWVVPQVDRMPAGGANTGITQAPEESNAGILALSGGLVLAAAAGGTYVVRRRRAA